MAHLEDIEARICIILFYFKERVNEKFVCMQGELYKEF